MKSLVEKLNESFVNEDSKIKHDYNGNKVEILQILTLKGIRSKFKGKDELETLEDMLDKNYGEDDLFYVAKVIKSDELDKGDIVFYPKKYDVANYWGLE